MTGQGPAPSIETRPRLSTVPLRKLIDDLKAEVPIWKHQRFSDGSEEWVGSP